MSNYEQAWKAYKWRRNQFWIVALGSLPVIGVVGYITNKLHYSRIDLSEIAAIAMMVLFFVTGLRFNLWRCPPRLYLRGSISVRCQAIQKLYCYVLVSYRTLTRTVAN
jgi:hypothetical protein